MSEYIKRQVIECIKNAKRIPLVDLNDVTGHLFCTWSARHNPSHTFMNRKWKRVKKLAQKAIDSLLAEGKIQISDDIIQQITLKTE